MRRLLPMLLLMFSLAASAQSGPSSEDALKARLLHQPLYLQQSLGSDKLHFDSTGAAQGKASLVSFTLCGIDVTGLKLKNNALQLTAHRVGLEFIDKNPKRVTLQARNGLGIGTHDEEMKVTIDAPAGGDYGPVLDAIFTDRLADLVPRMPVEWQSFARASILEEPVPDAGKPSPARGTRRIGGGIVAPRVLFAPEPQFSEAARLNRWAGNVLVYLQVDAAGEPVKIHLIRPLGLGLDEAAICSRACLQIPAGDGRRRAGSGRDERRGQLPDLLNARRWRRARLSSCVEPCFRSSSLPQPPWPSSSPCPPRLPFLACRRPPRRPCRASPRTASPRTSSFWPTTCSKAAAPARVADSSPQNTWRRSLRCSAWPLPGENGTYFQRVPMVNVSAKPESTFSLVTGKDSQPLTPGKDITATCQTAAAQVDIDQAPVVFVGYGIHAPELGWDDYAGVDVKGKVVLMFVNQPPSPEPTASGLPKTPFTGKALTYYGRWTYKYEEAARQGAVGAILIHETTMAAYPWTVVGSRWGRKTAYLADITNPRVPLAAWIQFDVASALFEHNGLDLRTLMKLARTPGFKAMALNSKFTAHLGSTIEPFDGQNVVAKLPAPASHRENEAYGHRVLLYTAHFDHLGINPAQSGDNIFNGAIDNASGDAMLLEVARAFQSAEEIDGSARDKLSTTPHAVYFAAVDAEEQGLLGAEYLAAHPPVPARDIALNLNFEGIFIMPAGIPEQLMVSGAERTSFLPQVAGVARSFGMEIIPDPLPAAGYYYRSDHFALARQGIPAFSIGAGNKFQGHDLAYGQAIAADYIAHRYHQPADEYSDKFDLRANARLAQLSIALGWQAMLSPTPITWNKGDEFEAARLR